MKDGTKPLLRLIRNKTFLTMNIAFNSWTRRGLLMTACALTMNQAEAGSRRFTYSYETTTMPKGAMELETWVTWKNQIADDPGLNKFDFRHEFEYGFSDRLQLAFYFADWSYVDGPSQSGDAEFKDVAVEAIYNLTDPNACPFGTALYGEVKAGDEEIEFEAKFLLQKNLGPWMLVYNIGGELVYENDFADDEAELKQTFGAAYQINPAWSVGVECMHEIAVPDVDTIGDSGVYLGPNVAWRHDQFSVAVTGLWQVTTLSDEPDFQLRTIFAFDF